MGQINDKICPSKLRLESSAPYSSTNDDNDLVIKKRQRHVYRDPMHQVELSHLYQHAIPILASFNCLFVFCHAQINSSFRSQSNTQSHSPSRENQRNTEEYRKALQVMAELMKDVDLSDDVLNSLQHRFNLNN
ncbi:hypothetical protein Ciccas_001459 [Cichlidogyrus casuarinus]|uniref:Uncharacterized protein n=1 Tax=Cichlidogyrus casuarinus TaxID=1844966 RepID=A0ABD2QJY5_9PLAT